MVKRLTLVLTFALVVGIALPAFAEVQNIKVSGDITFLGIKRLNYEMGTKQARKDNEESHFATITRVRLDADLTDMVTATVRFLNQRDWDDNHTSKANTSDEDVILDLAYVVFQEFFFSPLTLTLGRQELQFNDGIVVGDPDTNNNSDGLSTMTDYDLDARKAFDAIRATLDYSPLIVDIVFAQIQENIVLGTSSADQRDDEVLWGANARYDFGGAWQTVGELFVWKKLDRAVTGNNERELISNYGVQVKTNPTERTYVSAMLVKQLGHKWESTQSALVDHQAWAYQLVGRWAPDMKWDPVLMAIVSYYSGDNDPTNDNSRGWDPMYENQTNGHIINYLFNQTNAKNIDLRTSVMPLTDTTLTVDLVYLRANEPAASGQSITVYNPSHSSTTYTGNGAKMLGKEIDIALTHNYTEDVVLGLLYGAFIPGNAFSHKEEPIQELIASCKVSF